VELLLDVGANPNLESRAESDGLPLCAAACWGYLAVVQSLLRRGADPDLIEAGGSTALWWAARNGHVEVLTVLLEAEADPNVASPLVGAAQHGSVAATRLLLEHGAKQQPEALEWAERLAASDAEGETGHSEVADLLRASAPR